MFLKIQVWDSITPGALVTPGMGFTPTWCNTNKIRQVQYMDSSRQVRFIRKVRPQRVACQSRCFMYFLGEGLYKRHQRGEGE